MTTSYPVTVAALIVCPRVDDPQRRMIPSKERPCDECGALIAVSLATLERSEAKAEGTTFQCVECGAPKLEGLEIQPPTGAQVRELEESGYDGDAWSLREAWGKKVTRKKDGA